MGSRPPLYYIPGNRVLAKSNFRPCRLVDSAMRCRQQQQQLPVSAEIRQNQTSIVPMPSSAYKLYQLRQQAMFFLFFFNKITLLFLGISRRITFREEKTRHLVLVQTAVISSRVLIHYQTTDRPGKAHNLREKSLPFSLTKKTIKGNRPVLLLLFCLHTHTLSLSLKVYVIVIFLFYVYVQRCRMVLR